MNNKQQIAINVAQALSANLIALKSINASLQDLYNQYNNEGLTTVWANMATAAVNADGSIGAADGSPNTAHPITVGNLYKSQTALVNAVTLAIQFNNFMTNVAVITGNYTQTINDML